MTTAPQHCGSDRLHTENHDVWPSLLYRSTMSFHTYTQVIAEQAICCKCGEDVSVDGKTGKAARFPVCSLCNSNRAKLSMMFGGWPPQCFQNLPPAAQTQFWKDSLDASTRAGLEICLIKNVVNHEVKESTDRMGGRFLPLSMYKAQGMTKGQVDGACMLDIYGKLATCRVLQHKRCRPPLLLSNTSGDDRLCFFSLSRGDHRFLSQHVAHNV